MNRNEMGYMEYIFYAIYFNGFFLWTYYFFFFSMMPGHSKMQSMLILIVMVFMGVILDLIFVGRYERNWKNIIVTALLVPGGYTFYMQFHDRSVWYKWGPILVGIIWGCYLILLFARRINVELDRRKVILSRMRRAYLGACICTIILIIAFYRYFLFGNPQNNSMYIFGRSNDL